MGKSTLKAHSIVAISPIRESENTVVDNSTLSQMITWKPRQSKSGKTCNLMTSPDSLSFLDRLEHRLKEENRILPDCLHFVFFLLLLLLTFTLLDTHGCPPQATAGEC